MAKADRAVSLGISVLIVIVLILIVGFGVFLSTNLTTGVVSSRPSTQTFIHQLTQSPNPSVTSVATITIGSIVTFTVITTQVPAVTSTCYATSQNATQPVNETECGAPPYIMPLNTTLTQTADNTTTVVVANLGGVSAMRFELLQDFSISANGGVYPSPYLSGTILFISNSTTAVSPVTLQYLVNETGSTVQTLSKPNDVPNGENWAYMWKSGANSVPIVSGKPYLITFIITYADGLTQSESIVLIAD